MSADGVDVARRRFLTGATSVVGATGAGFAAVPFVASFQPSERARAINAPVEQNIDKIKPGALLTVKWRGQPVWIVRRTEESLAALRSLDDQLRDPESGEAQQPAYAQNAQRSIKPEFLILVGLCTHLGCSPTYRPDLAPGDLGADWKGGFFCPCHGSKFDLAGRVYAGVPAPTNLVVPPHSYLSDSRVIIGVDQERA